MVGICPITLAEQQGTNGRELGDEWIRWVGESMSEWNGVARLCRDLWAPIEFLFYSEKNRKVLENFNHMSDMTQLVYVLKIYFY